MEVPSLQCSNFTKSGLPLANSFITVSPLGFMLNEGLSIFVGLVPNLGRFHIIENGHDLLSHVFLALHHLDQLFETPFARGISFRKDGYGDS
ncbi:hypothetical protein EUGRSUZ_H02403 [Eucalyptus grandis]|uniref:Uncharacterized protein n=2 Tax=Eucalyptus grandis TaxID=71139 RepID=A0ACC3JSN0_EUCGR|nr:hypothetical protein EUGRSUZ_H02403 [Eucalyptus grandis]